jgi:dTMP kinase
MSNTGKNGLFMTFEGGEGAGKSTQVTRLAAALRARGHSVLVTREPGGTAAAEAMRGVLLDATFHLDAMTQFLLFTAARRDHLEKVIRPALAAGSIVLCDRYIDSTRAYQTARKTMTDRQILSLSKQALGSFLPDLTLIIDYDPAIGLLRAAERRGIATADAYELLDLAFHEAVRARFIKIGNSEPDRCAFVDGFGSVGALTAEIMNILDERFPDLQLGHD